MFSIHWGHGRRHWQLLLVVGLLLSLGVGLVLKLVLVLVLLLLMLVLRLKLMHRLLFVRKHGRVRHAVLRNALPGRLRGDDGCSCKTHVR